MLEPTGDDAAATALQRIIEGFCVQLLAPGPDGRLPFVGRLLHLIKVRSSPYRSWPGGLHFPRLLIGVATEQSAQLC